LCLLAGASGAARADSGGVVRARFLMGTRLSIETDGPVEAAVLEGAFDEVARLEGILSNWRESSELTRLNRTAAGGPVRCSPDLYAAVRAWLRWAAKSGGAFDPTIEPLTVRLGLRPAPFRLPEPGGAAAPGGAERAGSPPPSGPPVVGWRHVHLSRARRT